MAELAFKPSLFGIQSQLCWTFSLMPSYFSKIFEYYHSLTIFSLFYGQGSTLELRYEGRTQGWVLGWRMHWIKDFRQSFKSTASSHNDGTSLFHFNSLFWRSKFFTMRLPGLSCNKVCSNGLLERPSCICFYSNTHHPSTQWSFLPHGFK